MSTATPRTIRLKKKVRCTECTAKIIDGSVAVQMINAKGKTVAHLCNNCMAPGTVVS